MAVPKKKPDELTQAVKDWDKKTAARARANKAADAASTAAREAKDEVERILADRGHEGVKVGGNVVSTYELTHYYVVEANRAEFEAWAAQQDEEYLEPNRRVRGETLTSQMQLREENDEPLAPGVSKWTETKVSKRKA
jgi:hypothetical protein